MGASFVDKSQALCWNYCYSFHYPTGWPVCFSRMLDEAKLRLDAITNVQDHHKRYLKFQLPNTNPADFTERWFSFQDELILAGIRHDGGFVDKPFLSCWTSFPIQSYDQLRAIYHCIQDQFQIFRPGHLQIWCSPFGKLAKICRVFGIERLRLYAQPTKQASAEKGMTNSQFLVQQITQANYYQNYLSLFRIVQQSWSQPVQACCEEELALSFQNQLLWGLYLQQDLIGLLILEPTSLYGMPSLYVVDQMIHPGFRGTGLAGKFQSHVIYSTGDQYTYYFGEIESGNFAARKTAERLGRRLVRSEFFIPCVLLE